MPAESPARLSAPLAGRRPPRPGRRAVVLALALAAAPARGAEPAATVEIATPRDYGYTMGDRVETTVSVTVPESYVLEADDLPQPGTLDEGLDVRAVTWERDRADGRTRYRIHLAYQVFKGVRGAERATIPELPLRFAGPAPLEVKAPALDFSVVPLIPPDLADDQVVLRPAAPPEPAATAPHLRRLALYLAGAAGVGGALAWRRFGPARRARPFATAQRDVTRLLRGSVSPENFREAARRLHRALDASGGGTLFAGEIDRFCAERPAFAGSRDELAAFFALSQALFFTAPGSAPPAGYPPERLAALCRRLAAAERRPA